jgi:hypothetical protein
VYPPSTNPLMPFEARAMPSLSSIMSCGIAPLPILSSIPSPGFATTRPSALVLPPRLQLMFAHGVRSMDLSSEAQGAAIGDCTLPSFASAAYQLGMAPIPISTDEGGHPKDIVQNQSILFPIHSKSKLSERERGREKRKTRSQRRMQAETPLSSDSDDSD